MITRLVALVALSFVACLGKPQAGDPCGKPGFVCDDAANALECRGDKWVTLPCKGPSGCQRDDKTVSCDMANNVAGDLCGSTAEGKGMCTAAGTATLECRDGVLVETNTCTSCSVSAGRVVCRSN